MYQYIGQALTAAAAGSGELETQNISGALSGAYTKKRYYVTGNCTVADGVDVSFAAGSVIEFNGDYKFSVIGQIQLNGTASERITVKASATNPNNRWRGFLLCADVNEFTFGGGENGTVNKFTYVDFFNAEKLQQTEGNYHVTRGAAIFAYLYESLEITNCSFKNCRGWDFGGAIYLHQETGATTTFNNCTFENCSAEYDDPEMSGVGGAWGVSHGTYNISGMTYINCWGSYGQDLAYTVNLTSNVFTTQEHFMFTGSIVKYPASTNAPTPQTAGVEYYAIIVSATTFKLATSYANANAGTAIDVTAQASGTKIMDQIQEFWAFDATVNFS